MFLLVLSSLILLTECLPLSNATRLLVTFNGYYDVTTRHSAINGCLQPLTYSISDHSGPKNEQLSDFDSIQVDPNIVIDLALIRRNCSTNTHFKFIGFDSKIRSTTLSSSASSNAGGFFFRRSVFAAPPPTSHKSVTAVLKADVLWNLGYTGQGVKVAIFDTGLSRNHPHFKRIAEVTDWTNEGTTDDELGHGTFVAGVIAGGSRECPGFAPDAELHIYKVFTKKQVSYTSWFLDAFNHAILRGVNILNLSIGGPDFKDQPFIDKVLELTANGVLLISAIGNDGPIYGTLNNPADQMDAVGVGGINFDDQIARFSSRGMTTWELPGGYGRVKPDVVTYGSSVYGSALVGSGSTCRTLSGTSVASPVATGVAALLYSSVDVEHRAALTPGALKQALMAGARRLSTSANLFEQGAGRIDLLRSYHALARTVHTPQISLSPSYIDLTECPYFWPHCTQPLYAGGRPVIMNVTLISGIGVGSQIVEKPRWEPFVDEWGDRVHVGVGHSSEIWPWSGWLAVYLIVNPQYADWSGIASGRLRLTIRWEGARAKKNYVVLLPIRVKIIPTPPRSRRILWDQFHNLRYPPGYFPRDNLRLKNDPLDWLGDHIHTNFKGLYQHLRSSGYYIEVLGEPAMCFDPSHYGHMLIVDPEEEFFPEERRRLLTAVRELGMNLIVFADWYNATVMDKIRFFDDNTKQWWHPETGGANVPALNALLGQWGGLALSDRVYEGHYSLLGRKAHYASGTSIAAADGATLVYYQSSLRDQAEDVISGTEPLESHVPILAINREDHQVDYDKHERSKLSTHSPVSVSQNVGGMLAVYGDSNCLDSSHAQKDCFWLLDALLYYGSGGPLSPPGLRSLLTRGPINHTDTHSLPRRNYNQGTFASYSKVIELMASGDRLVYKPIPKCFQPDWLIGDPVANITSPSDFYRHFKMLSVDAGAPVGVAGQIGIPPKSLLDQADDMDPFKDFNWNADDSQLLPPSELRPPTGVAAENIVNDRGALKRLSNYSTVFLLVLLFALVLYSRRRRIKWRRWRLRFVAVARTIGRTLGM